VSRPFTLQAPSFKITRWERRRCWLFFRVDVPVWTLTTPLIFESALDGVVALRLEIPAGEETDFASIPPELWPFLPPAGRWALAAVFHDGLYRLPAVPRFLADAFFYQAMGWFDVPFGQRLAIYYAVRIFGGLCRRAQPTTPEAAP